MIDLNKIHYTPVKKYDLAETARILNLGFGRNTLYKILKELEIVNEENVPDEKYQNEGYLKLVVPFLRPNPMYVNHPKTLVVGEKGLNFIKEIVEKYLENNPVPRQERSKNSGPYRDKY
jgi:hypothetical protein